MSVCFNRPIAFVPYGHIYQIPNATSFRFWIPHRALSLGTSPGLITIGKGGKGDSFPHVFGCEWNPFGKVHDSTGKAKNEWAGILTLVHFISLT